MVLSSHVAFGGPRVLCINNKRDIGHDVKCHVKHLRVFTRVFSRRSNENDAHHEHNDRMCRPWTIFYLRDPSQIRLRIVLILLVLDEGANI